MCEGGIGGPLPSDLFWSAVCELVTMETAMVGEVVRETVSDKVSQCYFKCFLLMYNHTSVLLLLLMGFNKRYSHITVALTHYKPIIFNVPLMASKWRRAVKLLRDDWLHVVQAVPQGDLVTCPLKPADRHRQDNWRWRYMLLVLLIKYENKEQGQGNAEVRPPWGTFYVYSAFSCTFQSHI